MDRHCDEEVPDLALRDGMFDRIRIVCVGDKAHMSFKCVRKRRVLRNGGPHDQLTQFPDHRCAVTVPDDVGH